jgi:hypothetical protein
MIAKILWVFDVQLVHPDDNSFHKTDAALLWSKSPLFVTLKKREGISVPPIDA